MTHYDNSGSFFVWPSDRVYRSLPRDARMKSLNLYGSQCLSGLQIKLSSSEGTIASPIFGVGKKMLKLHMDHEVSTVSVKYRFGQSRCVTSIQFEVAKSTKSEETR